MPSFSYYQTEWQLPVLSDSEVRKISPTKFETCFFSLPRNQRPVPSKGGIKEVLTRGFVRILDDCVLGRDRAPILETWKKHRDWNSLCGSSRTSRSSKARTGNREFHELEHIIDPFRPLLTNESYMSRPTMDPNKTTDPRLAPPGLHEAASHMHQSDVLPKSTLALEECTLEAFYDLFCNAVPKARAHPPWDTILTEYKAHVVMHYGRRNVQHILLAYRRVRSYLCLSNVATDSDSRLSYLFQQTLSDNTSRESKIDCLQKKLP